MGWAEGRGPLLLLEKIFEGLAGVIGAQGGWGGCFFFPGHADFVKGAAITGIFLGHTLGHRLHALEALAGIEIHALLAGVEFESALGAEAGRRNGLEHGSALRAPRYGTGAWHVHRFRTHAVIVFRSRRSRFLLGRSSRFLPWLILAIAVLISMLTVFGCHNTSQAMAYCLASRFAKQVSCDFCPLNW